MLPAKPTRDTDRLLMSPGQRIKGEERIQMFPFGVIEFSDTSHSDELYKDNSAKDIKVNLTIQLGFCDTISHSAL